jgi:pseudouridine-5'-phosphate glycosidase
MLNCMDYSAEVKEALSARQPVLALESTIITHGMPYPDNLKTAQAVEAIVRAQGVTPATIAIMNGKIKIGLSEQDLDQLVHDKSAMKASKRDIAYVLQQKLNAGTTVSATLFCAHLAGINVFATGGIGGVHRGDAMDISADLIELAQTPIAVICAGAKAILDLPRTLEFLETYSIPVIGYGTKKLPAFYTSESEHTLPMQVNKINELADYLNIHWQLKMPSGVLIMNPVPKENEIAAEVIQPAIQQALQRAAENNVLGKEITPFLLKEVSSATQGKSLAANISLIKNNVLLGAQLARQLKEAEYA